MGSSPIRRVLSSPREAIVYASQEVGRTGKVFKSSSLRVINLALEDGNYAVEFWKPGAPGGIIKTISKSVKDGSLDIDRLPVFTDDLAVHIFAQ